MSTFVIKLVLSQGRFLQDVNYNPYGITKNITLYIKDSKEVKRTLKWYTRRYLFNTQEDSNERINE